MMLSEPTPESARTSAEISAEIVGLAFASAFEVREAERMREALAMCREEMNLRCSGSASIDEGSEQ